MTFAELWDIVERKNPQLKTGSVKMTSSNFKRAMMLAYNKGADSAKVSDFGDIMNEFFNTNRRNK